MIAGFRSAAGGRWGLFAAALVLFVGTLYWTVYTYDSAELTLGAAELGLVHSPGYPLYLMIAHLFTRLPFGDLGWRVNLFSAVCLALTAPALWLLLERLTAHRIASLLGAVTFLLGYTVWYNGTIAEVYAPQILTLTLVGLALEQLRRLRTPRSALLVGLAYGVAVAIHPGSVMFAPAVALTFILLRIRAGWCIASGLLALAVFTLTLFYFPLRQDANPRLNYMGIYNDVGVFEPVDLHTVSGVVWVIEGEQFDKLFFSEGPVPTLEQAADTLTTYIRNFAGIGLLIGAIGLVWIARDRGLLAVWATAWLPFTYFYLTYGAPDTDMMVGPGFLCFSVPVAFGLRWLLGLPRPLPVLAYLLPLAVAAITLPAIVQRNTQDVPGDAAYLLTAVPENALVFGVWGDIVPMEYVQTIHGVRPDLTLRNLFFFRSPQGVFAHAEVTDPTAPIVVLGDRVPIGVDPREFVITPLRLDGEVVGYMFGRQPT